MGFVMRTQKHCVKCDSKRTFYHQVIIIMILFFYLEVYYCLLYFVLGIDFVNIITMVDGVSVRMQIWSVNKIN